MLCLAAMAYIPSMDTLVAESTSRHRDTELICAPALTQMAIDAHLLARAATTDAVIIRLYQMSPPAVTIGRHQKWARLIDEDACSANGWDWVRRPTGGGALLHKDEINYAVVAPRGLLAATGPGEFRAVFELIGQLLSRCLQDLGIGPRLCAGERATPLSQHGLCGRSITGNEIAIAGRKIIAAAQLVTPTGILQHGTIYLRAPIPADRFWPVSVSETRPVDFEQRWADLHSTLPGRSAEEIVTVLARGLGQSLPAILHTGASSDSERAEIAAIVQEWVARDWRHSR